MSSCGGRSSPAPAPADARPVVSATGAAVGRGPATGRCARPARFGRAAARLITNIISNITNII
eukprot:9423804-Lingulodinium_polyedra.AAC.1